MEVEKFKREYVTPYLDYGLKIHVVGLNNEIHIVQMLARDSIINISIDNVDGEYGKPILRPLSDFLEKGTSGEVRKELDCSLEVIYDIWDLESGDKNLNEIPYKTYIIMCKNHIDFNRLIEKGFAIDKKTLK